jgi:hypothetical protein
MIEIMTMKKVERMKNINLKITKRAGDRGQIRMIDDKRR